MDERYCLVSIKQCPALFFFPTPQPLPSLSPAPWPLHPPPPPLCAPRLPHTAISNQSPAWLTCSRWLKQSHQTEEAPIISFMRSAAADSQPRFESQVGPQTALVEYDQGPDEVEEQQQEGGYRLTFTTSSKCFAGTNAQVQHTRTDSPMSTCFQCLAV